MGEKRKRGKKGCGGVGSRGRTTKPDQARQPAQHRGSPGAASPRPHRRTRGGSRRGPVQRGPARPGASGAATGGPGPHLSGEAGPGLARPGPTRLGPAPLGSAAPTRSLPAPSRPVPAGPSPSSWPPPACSACCRPPCPPRARATSAAAGSGGGARRLRPGPALGPSAASRRRGRPCGRRGIPAAPPGRHPPLPLLLPLPSDRHAAASPHPAPCDTPRCGTGSTGQSRQRREASAGSWAGGPRPRRGSPEGRGALRPPCAPVSAAFEVAASAGRWVRVRDPVPASSDLRARRRRRRAPVEPGEQDGAAGVFLRQPGRESCGEEAPAAGFAWRGFGSGAGAVKGCGHKPRSGAGPTASASCRQAGRIGQVAALSLQMIIITTA